MLEGSSVEERHCFGCTGLRNITKRNTVYDITSGDGEILSGNIDKVCDRDVSTMENCWIFWWGLGTSWGNSVTICVCTSVLIRALDLLKLLRKRGKRERERVKQSVMKRTAVPSKRHFIAPIYLEESGEENKQRERKRERAIKETVNPHMKTALLCFFNFLFTLATQY